jgi:hypothetical protein
VLLDNVTMYGRDYLGSGAETSTVISYQVNSEGMCQDLVIRFIGVNTLIGGTATVSFNPMAYCQGVQKDTSGAFDTQMKDLVAALFLYNQAANNYFKEN